MLTHRLIDPDDYTAHENGRRIGRIRFAPNGHRAGGSGSVNVVIPDAPFGDAGSINEAKSRSRAVSTASRDQQGPEKLAKAFATMAQADRAERGRWLPAAAQRAA